MQIILISKPGRAQRRVHLGPVGARVALGAVVLAGILLVFGGMRLGLSIPGNAPETSFVDWRQEVETQKQAVDQALRSALPDEGYTVNEALQSSCGIGYDEAGAILAEAWGLPESIIYVLCHHRSPQPKCDPHGLLCIVADTSRMVSAVLNENEYEPADHRMGTNPEFSESRDRVFDRLLSSYPQTSKLAASLTSNKFA